MLEQGEGPDREQQILDARLALEKTQAAKGLSAWEKDKVAGAVVDGKVGDVKQPHLREAIVETLSALGVTPDFLAAKLKEGLDANEEKFFAHEGVVQDERSVADHTVRLQYIRALFRLLGLEGQRGAPTIRAKTFVYKPMLRGGGEEIEVQKPNDAVLKRRMQAAKAHEKIGKSE